MRYFCSLLLALLTAHSPWAQLAILPVFDGAPIAESTWFVTRRGDSVQFDNVRFYLSDIQFKTVDNQIISAPQKAHLVDVFEPQTLNIAVAHVDFRRVATVRFNVGIDSLTNVSGAMGGDLDPQRGMYWAWQSGYINLKIEGKSPRCKTRKNAFLFHVGGYLPPFYAVRTVTLPIRGQCTEGVVLRVDFAKFFDNIDLAAQNSVMIPSAEAQQLADDAAKMFTLTAHEK